MLPKEIRTRLSKVICRRNFFIRSRNKFKGHLSQVNIRRNEYIMLQTEISSSCIKLGRRASEFTGLLTVVSGLVSQISIWRNEVGQRFNFSKPTSSARASCTFV